MVIAGVDPGKTGAVALITGDRLPRVLTIRDMPVAGGKVDPAGFAALCEDMIQLAGLDILWVVEQQSIRPMQQGAAKTMEGYGVLLGCLSALRQAVVVVTPAKWKSGTPGLGVGADKNASRALAARRFPAVARDLARVKDDGRAEAVLIGLWRWSPAGGSSTQPEVPWA